MIPRLSLVALLLLCLTVENVAEDMAGAPRWVITAECQMLLVPQKLALELVAELKTDGKTDAALERIQKLIGEGEIELLGLIVLTGNAGTRLISETIEEIRYSTEYDPPTLPDRVPQENAVEIFKAWPVVGVTPTAFETRNVGHTLELEAKVSSDGQWIDMEAVPQHVRFLRWVEFDAGRLPNGEHISLEQPYFHTMKNTLHLRLKNGQRALVGVHKLPDPNQKAFELFVLHVKATKSAASE